ANPAIATATTTSISVNPLLRRRFEAGGFMPLLRAASWPLSDADPPAQPIDPDGDAARPIGDFDAAPGRAAVGVEADCALGGIVLLAGDRQQRQLQLPRQLPDRAAANSIAVTGQIDLEGDRLVAQDRLRARQTQSGGELRRSAAQPEAAAPGRLVSDDQGQGEAENSQRDDQLDQRKAGLPAMARGNRLRPRFTRRGH